MDIKDVKNIWSEVKEELLQVVPETSFPWIEPLEAIGFEDGIFSVVTGQAFSIQIIRKNHYQQILDIFKQKNHNVERFEIIYDEEISKKFKKEKEKELKALRRQEEKKQQKESPDSLSTMQSSNLNLKYKFDNFVVGDNSKMAHAIAMSVAQNPAQKFNPLFIYGGSGLGKTHLMQAIGHYNLFNGSNLKVKYIKTEDYVNDLTTNLRMGKNINENMQKFRQKYRNVDILLIDDIQFVESKKRTMDEMFHTFDALYNKNKQIVLTSDRLPKDIPTLPDRLRTRFEMGIVVDITPPDYDTRVAILKQLAEEQNQVVPSDVFDFIATYFDKNVRELKGAYNKVIAYADIENADVTIEYAQKVLKGDYNKREYSMEEIASIVGNYFDVTIENFQSSARASKISEARHILVYLIREIMNSSYEEIAEYLNKKHPTILYSYQKIKTALKTDKELKTIIQNLKTKLSEEN